MCRAAKVQDNDFLDSQQTQRSQTDAAQGLIPCPLTLQSKAKTRPWLPARPTAKPRREVTNVDGLRSTPVEPVFSGLLLPAKQRRPRSQRGAKSGRGALAAKSQSAPRRVQSRFRP